MFPNIVLLKRTGINKMESIAFHMATRKLGPWQAYIFKLLDQVNHYKVAKFCFLFIGCHSTFLCKKTKDVKYNKRKRKREEQKIEIRIVFIL